MLHLKLLSDIGGQHFYRKKAKLHRTGTISDIMILGFYRASKLTGTGSKLPLTLLTVSQNLY